MKIKELVNQTVVEREMTAEEIAKMQQSQPGTTLEPLTNEKKMELFLASINEEPMPDSEPKLGYKWQPIYTSSSGFAWELVEDPTAFGTMKNPWQWISGMTVKLGNFYTDGTATYMAVQEGAPESITDTEYFESAD